MAHPNYYSYDHKDIVDGYKNPKTAKDMANYIRKICCKLGLTKYRTFKRDFTYDILAVDGSSAFMAGALIHTLAPYGVYHFIYKNDECSWKRFYCENYNNIFFVDDFYHSGKSFKIIAREA